MSTSTTKNTATRERAVNLRPWEARAWAAGRLGLLVRPVVPQPADSWMLTGGRIDYSDVFTPFGQGRYFATYSEMWANYYQTWTKDGQTHHRKWWWIKHPDSNDEIKPPLGPPSTPIWGREAWAGHFIWAGCKAGEIGGPEGTCIFYRAEGDDAPAGMGGCTKGQREGAWRSAATMPRWASRLSGVSTTIKVKRLGEIEPREAWAAGATCDCMSPAPMCLGNLVALVALLSQHYGKAVGPDSWWWLTFFDDTTPR